MPFIALEQHGQQMPPEWLGPAEATMWMSQHTPEATVRHNGGLLLSVEARDPWSAVEEAGDLIESMAARVAVGMPGGPRFEPYSEVFRLRHRQEVSARKASPPSRHSFSEATERALFGDRATTHNLPSGGRDPHKRLCTEH